MAKKGKENLELQAKVLRDVSEEICKSFIDRDLNLAECLSILGVVAAECLLDADLKGQYWMSFFASLNATILANTKNPKGQSTQVFACPIGS